MGDPVVQEASPSTRRRLCSALPLLTGLSCTTARPLHPVRMVLCCYTLLAASCSVGFFKKNFLHKERFDAVILSNLL